MSLEGSPEIDDGRWSGSPCVLGISRQSFTSLCSIVSGGLDTAGVRRLLDHRKGI
jgi:hypothetical protein